MTPRPVARPSDQPPLTERESRILGHVVQQYIERGEPVASLWIAQHGNVGLSSASVRTVMAHLEDAGYIHQPHTSAGRVPTDRGYRYFVDRLLRRRRRRAHAPADVEERLRQARTVSDVLSNVSHELSVASHHLAFACMPRLAAMTPSNPLFIEGSWFLAEEVSDETNRVPLGILRTLLAMVERKDLLVRLLDEYLDAPGLTVVIGTENRRPEMQPFSLVAATYFDGTRTGRIGVIGPRRMRYGRAISAVDQVSAAVSRVLVAQAAASHDDRRSDTATA